LDLQGKAATFLVESSLKSQNRFRADQMQELLLKGFPLPQTGAADHYGLHGDMGVVVLMVMVMIVLMVMLMVGSDRALLRGVPEVGIVARISAPGGQQQERIHPAPGHWEHGGARPETGANLANNLLQPCSVQAVSPADENEISGLKLILEEVLDRSQVIKAGVRPALGIHRLGITNHMSRRKSLAIHHCDHGMHAGPGADGWPAEGRYEGFG
jgi:hypothetical protein